MLHLCTCSCHARLLEEKFPGDTEVLTALWLEFYLDLAPFIACHVVKMCLFWNFDVGFLDLQMLCHAVAQTFLRSPYYRLTLILHWSKMCFFWTVVGWSRCQAVRPRVHLRLYQSLTPNSSYLNSSLKLSIPVGSGHTSTGSSMWGLRAGGVLGDTNIHLHINKCLSCCSRDHVSLL